ncbi:MAG: RidA family protein [Candidatus Bathyarchaeia archaeon]
MTSQVENELAKLGLKLPVPLKPAGNYVGAKRVGNIVFVSGQGPSIELPTGERYSIKGKVGRDLTVEEGYEAARLCALNCLAQLKALIGDLDKVESVLKVTGFVNSADGFNKQPAVMNGFTDLLAKIFGPERGVPARIALPVSLEGWIAVEADMIVAVKD